MGTEDTRRDLQAAVEARRELGPEAGLAGINFARAFGRVAHQLGSRG